MAHPRKLLRHKIVEILKAANTAAGQRVFAHRVEPFRPGELPAIAVYMPSETVDEDASSETSPRELKRDPGVEIAGWVGHTDGYTMDDRMDDLAEQIEAAIDADRYLSGEAGDTMLTGTTMQARAEDGRSDPTIGIVVLTYKVTYRTSPFVGPLDDFLTAEQSMPIQGAQPDTVPAGDVFTVQEAPP